VEGSQEGRVLEWLAKVLDGAGTPGALAGVGIVVGRDEDDRRCAASREQRLVELEATHPSESHVQHEATGAHAVACLQEFLGGAERFDREPGGAQQPSECAEERPVVVDDADERASDGCVAIVQGASVPARILGRRRARVL
jgi:hypothetical protein